MILKNARIILEDKEIKNGWIEIEDKKIKNIGEGATTLDGTDLNGKTIMPGFIECHVHGGYGVDFETGTVEGYKKFAKLVAQEGVTKYCQGSVTNSQENNIKYFGAFKEFMASQTEPAAICLGCHLEGPFISPEKKGAHELELLAKPNEKDMQELIDLSGNNIRVVTYANNLQDGSFTKFLLKNHIIPSMGHTPTSYDDAMRDYKLGAKHCTHLFNAMSGVDHREPGLATLALDYDDFLVEVISDGIHVAQPVLELIYRAKGPKQICIITDAMNAKGMPDGEYKLGNLDVVKKGMRVALKSSGMLAGAGATYDHNVRIYHSLIGMSLVELSWMTATNIAHQLGIYEETGSIEVNKLADLVVVDDDLNIAMTIVEGQVAFQK
jgi:N-acetylglucosamine-6-phosphate deacetylase